MVVVSFTREELAEVIKVAGDRRDYGEREGMYFCGEVTVWGRRLTEEQERWLAVRKEAAARLDAETAEVTFNWGNICDPYKLRAEDKDACCGRNYYARSPGGVWISFDDLPEPTFDRLEARIAAGEVTDAYKVYLRRLSDGPEQRRQARWRSKREALARSHPDVVERASVKVPELPPDPLDEHGALLVARARSANDTEPGLSRRRIQELADWYSDQGHCRHNARTLDTAALDEELRAILREEVEFPEHVEIEFERIMQIVYSGPHHDSERR
jgi:hypothetical protein